MKTIELEYDTSTGELKDGDNHITYHTGLNHRVKQDGDKLGGGKISVAELKELKEAGYTAHEIAELRASGVL